MLKIAINGTGRMAINTALLALEDDSVKLVQIYGRESNPFLGQDIGRLLGIDNQGITIAPIQNGLSDNAICIDFSHPSLTLELLDKTKDTPLLIGTTGFSDQEMSQIIKAAKNRPILFAPNTSLGVAVLRKLAKDVAQILGPDYDVDINDTHHKHKKDAPSGTAKSIMEAVSEVPGFHVSAKPVNLRERGQINVTVERSGGIIGEHTISFSSDHEVVSITHKAIDRKLFARGAIDAARWLANAAPGFYKMEDVVGL